MKKCFMMSSRIFKYEKILEHSRRHANFQFLSTPPNLSSGPVKLPMNYHESLIWKYLYNALARLSHSSSGFIPQRFYRKRLLLA